MIIFPIIGTAMCITGVIMTHSKDKSNFSTGVILGMFGLVINVASLILQTL